VQDCSADKGEATINELERRIADLRARLPRHSVPASMALELDALEDELERMRNNMDTATQSGKNESGACV
jgi:HAMP domain-containing protein